MGYWSVDVKESHSTDSASAVLSLARRFGGRGLILFCTRIASQCIQREALFDLEEVA